MQDLIVRNIFTFLIGSSEQCRLGLLPVFLILLCQCDKLMCLQLGFIRTPFLTSNQCWLQLLPTNNIHEVILSRISF